MILIADTVIVEWQTIGIISGIVFTIVGGTVTISTVYLKLFVKNHVSDELVKQNNHIDLKRDEMMSELRRDFIQKDVIEKEVQNLKDRIENLKDRVKGR
jgi:NhaP-type Na+/H+ or K+/H+ antiporter